MSIITKNLIGNLSSFNGQHNLVRFVEAAWPLLEPANPFIHGWHLDAICEHLDAVTTGQIRNLVINMPPRHMKSLLVSVFWPCWEWTNHPERRWLFASYSHQLALRDSNKCRRLINSDWYRSNYGSVFHLSADQNQKGRFDNNKSGYRIATSIGGVGTGEGGDRIVVDDPHNVKSSESRIRRSGAIAWWDGTMATRGNNPKTVARVIVMQRVHESDLTGHVLEQGGYEHLCLPAEYDGQRHITCIGWQDPRTQIGELLCPARFGSAEIEELKLRLGSRASAGQLQQKPAPAEGAIFKMRWFKNRFSTMPACVRVATFWDTAVKTNQENDETACLTIGVTADNVPHILRSAHGRWETPEVVERLVNQSTFLREKFGSTYAGDYVEDKMNGTTLIQYVRRSHPLCTVIPLAVEKDKVSRAHGVAPLCEGGSVLLPDPEIFPQTRIWVDDLLASLTTFPTAKHDDLTDVFVYALKWFLGGYGQQRVSKRGRGGMV